MALPWIPPSWLIFLKFFLWTQSPGKTPTTLHRKHIFCHLHQWSYPTLQGWVKKCGLTSMLRTLTSYLILFILNRLVQSRKTAEAAPILWSFLILIIFQLVYRTLKLLHPWEWPVLNPEKAFYFVFQLRTIVFKIYLALRSFHLYVMGYCYSLHIWSLYVLSHHLLLLQLLKMMRQTS